MHITVIGCGYLGATHAAALAELGFSVLGLDTDPDAVATLNRGVAPFHEPGLNTLLARHTAQGRLRFTTDYRQAATFSDAHFLCVGTPALPSGGADLSQVQAAVDGLAPYLVPDTLLIGKSTVPVGTARKVAARLDAEVAWNPEFLREGHAVADTLHPDRIVAGVTSSRAEDILRQIYARPLTEGTPFLVSDLATAELTKMAANAFLATKISFINAMAEVCDAAGADVRKLAEALGHDARIGKEFLQAGIGFGGGCLPKDIRAFRARAQELGAGQALSFLREVDAVNTRARCRLVEKTRVLLGGSVSGRRIGIWGATFKPGTDDVRNSPALDIARRLHLCGAAVRVCDPRGTANARQVLPDVEYTDDPMSAAEDAEVLLHLTEWPIFRKLGPEDVGKRVAERRLVDGRGCLDVPVWRAAGWNVF